MSWNFEIFLKSKTLDYPESRFEILILGNPNPLSFFHEFLI